MSKHYRVFPAPLSLLLALVLQGAAPAQSPFVGDDVYVNCEYRLAAHFPGEPKFRDVIYRDGARSAPARQFYIERDTGLLSVTVAHFPEGPAIDQSLLEPAAAAFRSRGTVRFESSVYYDEPIIPGRQLNILLADGRVLRAHVYVADHRLYLTEATSASSDSSAFRFEQSVSFIDANGTDLDTNPPVPGATIGSSAGLPSRRYDCSRLYRR